MKQPEHILNHSNPLIKNLQEKAQVLNKLNLLFQTILPDHLQKHCKIANMRDETLVIKVTSAAWAVKLRLIESTLLKSLLDNGLTIKKFKYLIDPTTPI